jgi:hypothetical protein
MMTYLYHVYNGVAVRTPYDLDEHLSLDAIDWLHTEPWAEPPLVAQFTRCRKCHCKLSECRHGKENDQRYAE